MKSYTLLYLCVLSLLFFLLCISFCASSKRTFPQNIGSSTERSGKKGSLGICIGPGCSCVAPSGSKAPSSQLPCLRHGVFPAEGKPRKVVPSCQLHLGKITLEAARLPSVPQGAQSAPLQKGGEERLGEREETSTCLTG